MGFPPRETVLLMGYPYTRGQLRWWVYSHVGGIGSSSGRDPIRDRRIQSVDGLNPRFRPIFCRSERTIYIYGFLYLDYPLNVSVSYGHKSNYSLETTSRKYDLLRTKVSGMIQSLHVWSVWRNSDCICSVNGSMRHKVYLRGFPYLDYSLDALVLWIY